MKKTALALLWLVSMTGCGRAPADTGQDEQPVTMTKVFDIARYGNTAEFQIAWQNLANKRPDDLDPRTGMSLAHYAAANRTSPLMIAYVLNAGANPNLKDRAGLTPLRHAIMANGQTAIRNLALRTRERQGNAYNKTPVRLDVVGPDGKTDEQVCREILNRGEVHRGCQVLFEVAYGGATRSTSEEMPGVMRDLGNARNNPDLQ